MTMDLEQLDDIAALRMDNRKANAMNPEMLVGLDGSLVEFLESGAKALVITGYDRFFSAGLDLVTLDRLDHDGMLGFMRLFQRVMLSLFWCERPVVAAVNGHAVAGGCVLAMQADARIATNGRMSFGLNETRLGVGLPIVVAETLRAQVSPAVLGNIAIEGLLYDGEQAEAYGLLHERVEQDSVLSRAQARARELAEIPPAAYVQAKRGIRAPARAAIHAAGTEAEEAWLSTWFSPEATALRTEMVKQLTSKKS